ncbi:branched-chain amino acid aminotransferase [Bacillus sp. FJAT-49705]|uniref:Branched-chain amino acid aminotransferase n=1 Tax=Cytobacillus citreus TaxID=2833586 RepID=A0ABS5NP20_9BACI|nr:branched-chain amino acid aminotransferase [Cytobacillus citreus]MBS4189567.1 branched-chain amino acid aminotransferase [Cytobacillus citreus]
MLNKKLHEYFSNKIANSKLIETYKEEIAYAKKHKILEEDITIIEKEDNTRFNDALIERYDKESEEMLAEESSNFLDQPVSYLKKQIKEFIYIESKWFDLIGAESVCIEVDDVFGTYEVMLGLKLQKKYENKLKEKINEGLKGEVKYSLLFSHADGLWEFNFALNGVDGFNDELSINETCRIIYLYLFKLVEAVEEDMQ